MSILMEKQKTYKIHKSKAIRETLQLQIEEL